VSLKSCISNDSPFYTLDLVRNMGAAYAELPSFPPATPQQETCLVCSKGEDTKSEGNDLLECERCEEPWHLKCLTPPLDSVPEGEWHCPHCLDLVLDYSKSSSTSKATKATTKTGKKREAEEEGKAEGKKNSNGKKTTTKKAKSSK
jgi:hypothetical protein